MLRCDSCRSGDDDVANGDRYADVIVVGSGVVMMQIRTDVQM
jgi:hypothetical protein